MIFCCSREELCHHLLVNNRITRTRSRTDERGYTYVRWSNGAHSHVASEDDHTPAHRTEADYDSNCGRCWLGQPHSEREHARKIGLGQ